MDRRLIQCGEDRAHIEEMLKLAESEEYCLKGWGDKEHNRDGCCCCNCIYQRPINSHPWNQKVLTRGPMSNVIGWACASEDLHPNVTFFDNPHGMCECYSRGK